MDNIYPVGSIFLSMEETNPSEYFGGTWEQICQGRTLLGVGSPVDNNTNWCGTLNNDSYGFWCGEMGGQYNHHLTIAEMPSHAHDVVSVNKNDNGYLASNGNGADFILNYNARITYSVDTRGWLNKVQMTATGGSGWHNNVMPYLAVYIWKRVS